MGDFIDIPPLSQVLSVGKAMKYFIAEFIHLVRHRTSRRNLKILVGLLAVFILFVVSYTVLFHLFMAAEGQSYSWLTGVYWTLTVMSTLGFGDITFSTDLGRLFSMGVLLTGMVFVLVLLPFTFIEFFYAPWMEAQSATRVPRRLPRPLSGHVVLTHHDSVTSSLIDKLTHFNTPYVLLVANLADALELHDAGVNVVLGELADPETYRAVHVEQAGLVATTTNDVINTTVVFVVHELNPDVPIIATANDSASIDILQLAGCTHVIQLGEMMGQYLARRTYGGDAIAHVIGQVGQLFIAEAAVGRTPLVGKTLRESQLRETTEVSVLGGWERGQYKVFGPDAVIDPSTVLVLAGTQAQIDNCNELFCIYFASDYRAVIIGAGRVGRATGQVLKEQGIDFRIIEQQPDRIRDTDTYIQGNAAELAVLKEAGLMESSTVFITTHDDETNIYLTIYCRRLRPEIQIITRANLERNVSTLHRAGADLVMSYASLGSNTIFNLLQGGDILMLAEGLDLFKVKVPPSVVGKTIAQTDIRSRTGCSIVAFEDGEGIQVNPDPSLLLTAGAEILLIGTVEAETQFLKHYGKG